MQRQNLLGLITACLMLHSACQSGTAASISFTAAKDNSIFSESSTNSNGLGEDLHTGRSGGTNAGIRRALIMFDIAAHVPPQAIINSVQLKMTVTEVPTQTGPDPVAVSLHRLLADWGEGTSDSGGGQGSGSGAPATDGDATWASRFHDAVNPVPWTSPGGDFDSNATASQDVPKLLGAVVTWQSAGMVADVQNWLDNPASNFGWIVLSDLDELGQRSTRRFGSKDAALTDLQPILTIDYTPVPEPSMVWLATCGFASLGPIRRRLSQLRSRRQPWPLS